MFGYEEAVTMAQNQKAPARRVGFFAGNALTDRLSAEGHQAVPGRGDLGLVALATSS